MSAPLLLRLPLAGAVRGYTSTRVGGGSAAPYASLNLGLNTDDDPQAVRRNREAALAAGGAPALAPVHLCQVHGEGIREAGRDDAGKGSQAWDQGLPACDAVFTRVRGLPLSIGHADCLAVLLLDLEAGLLGLAHAGWRGALAQLPAKLAARLIAEGAQPQRLQAVLSPCLGPQHLELSEREFGLFQAADGTLGDYCSVLKAGHFKLDLWTCARKQLEQAGLGAYRIHGQSLDTYEHPELFFSHRRDQGRTGRMLTQAWLE